MGKAPLHGGFRNPVGLARSPDGLSATGGNGTVTLTWTASVSATSYNIKSTTTSGIDYSVVGTTSSTSFVDTGLTNGSPVYYVVSPSTRLAREATARSKRHSRRASRSPGRDRFVGQRFGGNPVERGFGRDQLFGQTRRNQRRALHGALYGHGHQLSRHERDQRVRVLLRGHASNAGGEGSASAEGVGKPTTNALRAFLRFDEQSGSFAGDSAGNSWKRHPRRRKHLGRGENQQCGQLQRQHQLRHIAGGLMAGVTDFTVSAWVKLNSATNNTRIFDFGTGTAGYMELCPKNGNNGFMRYEIVSGGTVQQINTTYTFPTGVWTHVALTQSGSTGTLYINGSAVGTNTGLTLNPSNLGSTTLNTSANRSGTIPISTGRSMSSKSMAGVERLGVGTLAGTLAARQA